MSKTLRLWLGLGLVFVLSFAVLIKYGWDLYREAPPIPVSIQTESGTELYSKTEIQAGQNAWQSMGGQQVGSVWGHGAYVAPDWSADWLHREAQWMLDSLARGMGLGNYAQASAEQKVLLEHRVQREMRTNSYDAQSHILRISDFRATALRSVAAHYDSLFGNKGLKELRAAYAIPAQAMPDSLRRHQMSGFFFWAAWVCVTEKPGSTISYTNNWPGDDVIGNKPTPALFLWSILSVIALLVGIAVLAWFRARGHESEEAEHIPAVDPLRSLKPTASMSASVKYFWTVGLLFVLQMVMGVIGAHYGVEGNGFYGIPLDQYFPYAVSRAWHTQLGVFWIATAWLGAGLFIAPVIAGREPKFQALLVHVLHFCLYVIVLGSLAGEWLGIMQKLSLNTNFWFGTQGYEYVDLGRFWQIFLFAGLFIWLGLMARCLLPALYKAKQNRSLLAVFTLSAVAIAAFYGAGLMWGQHTHLAVAEYWRWWVVHLWVEGFFEVFATAVIAFLFTSMGLLDRAKAGAGVVFSTAVFLGGGIIGTFHHLYFTGTPTAVLAWGSVFSALEVVPLTLMGFEAYGNFRTMHLAPWVRAYRWPILCFVAVAFWNLVGAGILGFLINTPIALYYMQGLNLTPLHGHAALFGVYGFLGLGLILFCLRVYGQDRIFDSKLLPTAFWSMNIGLGLMCLLTLLPMGMAQTWASMVHGMWYARSAEFMQQDFMNVFRWFRVPGDILFALGGTLIAIFIVKVKRK